MRFTIISPTGFIIGVLFETFLMWKLKNGNFCHPLHPNYHRGDFKDHLKNYYLIKSFNFNSTKPVFGTKFFLNIFDVGIGTKEYLKDLVSDIVETEYLPKICR